MLRWDSLEGRVWSLPVSTPDDSVWLILWSEPAPEKAVEVFYIGPAPGDSLSPVAWTSGP